MDCILSEIFARGGKKEGREFRFLCPAHDDHHPSARWNPDKRVWCCDSCKAGGGERDLAQRLGLRPYATGFTPAPRRQISNTSVDPKSSEKAKRRLLVTWQEAKPITKGDPVDKYLQNRGLCLKEYPSALRFHLKLPYRHKDGSFTYHPAMIASVTGHDEELVSLHRTYLSPEGKKANVPEPKKFMTAIREGATRGAAIKLFPPQSQLAVAEGIETALAIHLGSGVPTWAAVTAGGLAALIMPPDVQELIICADHDASRSGQEAAKILAEREAQKRTVKIVTPDELGKDWADIYFQERVNVEIEARGSN